MKRRDVIKAAVATPAAALLFNLKLLPAAAAGRNDTLVVAIGNGPNSMDIHRKGTNRPSYQHAVNLYDRLIGYGTKTLPNGSSMYDYEVLEPELAESWTVAADGKSIDFKLRMNATFWDGTPVTAADVKWSFDRAVSVGGFPSVQMKAGLLEKTEQFEALDTHTFRIKLPRSSKLTLPDLGVPVPIIINSALAKANATTADPWATEYLHEKPAGGGAFMLERWEPGQQTVYKRFDDWKSGPVPAVKRVVIREVPSSSTRRALIERGDVDVSLDIPAKDAKELQAAGKIKVDGVPIENSQYAIGLNVNIKPFDDKRVRQAIAYAIPYEEIFRAAAYERGVPMYGASSFEPTSIDWPQPFPYTTDYDKAKALLAEAGHAQGFEVPLSINLGLAQWTEPTALLIQEGLAKVGIKTSIDKIPGASWRSKALVEKGLAFHLKNFGGWLNYPDYYFFWVYQKGHLFNSMNYHNPEIESLVESTLHLPVEDPMYGKNVRRMIAIAFDEVPLIPLWQPYLDVAMQPTVSGYEYWFHRQLDLRRFEKASS
ncbi:MAG: ABC transporter substrate-binding protein [Gammaproteobacteria bacterium]|nr:ABC transporter substrate-binding protein [Gammaproteobacteria bacterium]